MTGVSSILVHVDATPESADRLEVARRLGLQLDARVTALFGAAVDTERSSYGYSAAAALEAQANDWEEIARVDARTRLQSAACTVDPTIAWCEVAGDSVTHAFLGEAVYAGLLLVGRQPPAATVRAAPAHDRVSEPETAPWDST